MNFPVANFRSFSFGESETVTEVCGVFCLLARQICKTYLFIYVPKAVQSRFLVLKEQYKVGFCTKNLVCTKRQVCTLYSVLLLYVP